MRRRTHSWSAPLAVVVAAISAISLTADTLAMGGKPVHGVPAVRAVERRLAVGSGPEAIVVGVLRNISENRIAAAREQLDHLLEVNPNFRLAQLIKGDLLMARVGPVGTLGSLPDAPADRLSDLRDEARARIQRQQARIPDGRVPANLLRLSPDQKYAVVVDTNRSTLFLFENQAGAPRYVADYYITIGRNGVEKSREGDKRTPVGVYHVTANLPREKLTDFYGSGAFPLSYPNEWDRRNGRDGHGIWLHGTPPDTYSRPPRASDGCVVLTNQDLESIGSRLQPGVTPVVISNDLEWVGNTELERTRADLETAIERWREDWESRRTDEYLSHYARSFSSGSAGLEQWAAQKRQVNASKQWVKVKLADMSLFLYPGREPVAVATFVQDYRSNNLSNLMKKRIYWIREGERWKIIHEGAA
ncbi:MAG: L,D-transpeptidase family protein [Betaproteobacteria bacterium]